MARKQIFFAYESNHPDNRDAIKKAVEEYNKYQKTYHVKRWEDLSVNGRVIGKKILEAIDECEVFACDLTYLNHNVFFELGYAIARKKQLGIFVNTSVKNAKENYSDLKILKNIGYTSFCNSKDILTEFQKKSCTTKILIDDLIKNFDSISTIYDYFFINTPTHNQAALVLDDFFETSDLKYCTNKPSEIGYQPLNSYLTFIKQSRNVILHMVGSDKIDYTTVNAEYSLYAGISCGLDKKILLLAPGPYKAPIDYTDMLLEYFESNQCLDNLKFWIDQNINSDSSLELHDSKSSEDAFSNIQTKELSLLKLGIGVGVAEKDDMMAGCFVETNAYNNICNNKTGLIVVGRKGVGKTAIFLKLIEDVQEKNHIFNIVLKPDSTELLENVELARLYNNPRSKKALLKTVWKYIISVKIFFALCNRKETLKLSDPQIEEFDSLYNKYKKLENLNFYAMIRYIAEETKSNDLLNDPSVLEKINSKIIPLISICQSYFKDKKFQVINIFADNLDLGWELKNDLNLQADMILELLEYTASLNHFYNASVPVKIFLRKDIFNYLLSTAREADKLKLESYEIKWNDFPQELKHILEARFRYALEEENLNNIDVWKDYFKFTNKKDPFEVILKQIVKRPRDIIYFVSRLFESAINRNSLYVEDDDLIYANNEYLNFLYTNLISEYKVEYPEIDKILALLKETYKDIFFKSQEILFLKFKDTLQDGLCDLERTSKLIEKLFEDGYLYGVYKGEKIYRYERVVELSQHPILKFGFIRLGHKNKIGVVFNLKTNTD